MRAPEPAEALGAALGVALGTQVVRLVPVSGGDINTAYRADCADGESVFVKTHPAPPAGAFTAEAEGLAWLGSAGAVAVPSVRAVRDHVDAEAGPWFLALDWIERVRPRRHDAAALGRGLAALHAAGAATFGLARNGFLATLHQDNTATADWPTFWWQCRLEPSVRAARDAGLLDAADVAAFDRLATRLHLLAGPVEPPARLHGDLWQGNIVHSASGPWLVDPAAYGGHREVDLAMLALFGADITTVIAAYDEVAPLADGWPDRVALWQLWPLLAHLRLFGAPWRARVMATLAEVA